MGDVTAIAWTDRTFNPWEGCQKVGPGCDHCYAETRNARFGGGTAPNWGPGAPRRLTSRENWNKPRKWNREAAEAGIRLKVFCASLADVFDNAVDPAWRFALWTLIEETPHLDWQLVTKRIGNVEKMVPSTWQEKWPPNVWLVITVVNQEEADRDIPKLLNLGALFNIEIVGLSMEPLLGQMDISRYMWPVHPRWPAMYRSPAEAIAAGAEVTYHRQALISAEIKLLDWVIVGGESGPNARPMHPDWVRSLRDQCAAAGAAFFFKQWGEWLPVVLADDGTREYCAPEDGGDDFRFLGARRKPTTFVGDQCMWRVGKKAAGHLLDGREHREFPA